MRVGGSGEQLHSTFRTILARSGMMLPLDMQVFWVLWGLVLPLTLYVCTIKTVTGRLATRQMARGVAVALAAIISLPVLLAPEVVQSIVLYMAPERFTLADLEVIVGLLVVYKLIPLMKYPLITGLATVLVAGSFFVLRAHRGKSIGVPVSLLVVVALCSGGYLYTHNPLPKDSRIIEKIQKHEPLLRELVHYYATHPPYSVRPRQEHLKRVREIEKIASVRAVQITSLEPVSERENAKTQPNSYFATILLTAKSGYQTCTPRYGCISKSIRYWSHGTNEVGDSTRKRPERHLRKFQSLDEFPPGWKLGECVVRDIDSNWQIVLCY